MNPYIFRGRPWASSISCSPVRKEKEGASNCKTSMTASCYKIIPVPRKFKPFDQLAMKCYEASVLQKCATGCALAAASTSGGGCMEMGDLPQTCQGDRALPISLNRRKYGSKTKFIRRRQNKKKGGKNKNAKTLGRKRKVPRYPYTLSYLFPSGKWVPFT